MYQSDDEKVIRFEQSDLNRFKVFTLIFALSNVVAIFINITVDKSLAILINYTGMFFLIIGVFFISKNYKKLYSGLLVAFLLLINFVTNIAEDIFAVLYPIPEITENNATTLINSAEFVKQINLMLLILVVSGILTLIVSIIFTNWFNNNFAKSNPTKAFLYFGLSYFISSILIVYSTFSAFEFLKSAKSNPNSVDLTSLATISILLLIGTIGLIISSISKIIAGIKMYNRANDMANHKYNDYYFPTDYKSPYSSSYVKNALVSSSTYNNTGYSSYSSSYSEFSCKNCGMELTPNALFCQSCGTKTKIVSNYQPL